MVKCQYCDFEACRSCCERYMLDQTVAKCMDTNCNKEWTRKHIVENFTKTFVSGPWKKNREKVLFDKEKALLPATQAMVQTRIEQDKITQEIKEINDEIKKIKKTYSLLWEKKNRLERQRNLNGGLSKTTNNINYVRACPDGDCRGYLNTDWMCGICNNTTCSKCHIIILPGSLHKCNNDDLLTASLLNKDTKPCPKCSTGIFKIDGCDQMWCTLCHTAFSWKTGHIENTIHNPHYFEYMRRTHGSVPRNPGDVGRCEDQGIITNMDLQLIYHVGITCEKLYRKKAQIKDTRKDYENILNTQKQLNIYIENIVRTHRHVRFVDIIRYRTDIERDNRELRINYLMNKITEKEFTQKLFRKQKDTEKKQEYTRILNVYTTVAHDILLRMIHTYKTHYNNFAVDYYNEEMIDNIMKIMESVVEEAKGLDVYIQELFKETSNTFNTKMINFTSISSRFGKVGVII